jgi:hypothetical protein
MTIENDTSSLPGTSRRSRWDPLLECETHQFHVQHSPPLSLRQFYRSTITVVPDAKHWKPSGIYHAPVLHEDELPKSKDSVPEIRVKSRKSSRPPWYPAGCNKYVRPTSPNDEKNPQKSEPITTNSRPDTSSNLRFRTTKEKKIPWHPSGNKKCEPIPYFDAPSLRWSLRDVKQVMSELESRTNNTPTNQK